MIEDKKMTLDQYKLKAANKREEEMSFRTRSTNIKCDKCDGIYRYKDSFMVFMSNPPQQLVTCDKCKDEQYIPC